MAERSFALFDIDNTIYQGYVIFGLAQAEVDVKLFPKEVLKQLYEDTNLYVQKKILYADYANQAMTHWAEGLVGKSYNEVLIHAKDFLRNNQKNFFNFFKVLTKRLADKHDLYLVTAEPEFVCQAIGNMFPITGSVASKFYVSDGRFTGMARVLATSQDKGLAIDSMLASHTTDNSIAFGDSSSDVDMLERATYKICVDHPKSTLRDIALERGPDKGWFVVQAEDIVEKIARLRLI